jgi:hypothetical protein
MSDSTDKAGFDKSSNCGAFCQRDDVIRSIGFESYADYLQSALWEWVKTTLLDDPSSNRCLCCGSRTGLVWHHRDYRIELLVGNFSNWPPIIVRLCNDCHRAIHGDEKQWFEMEIVDERLRELRERFSHDSASATRARLTTKVRGEFDEFDRFADRFQRLSWPSTLVNGRNGPRAHCSRDFLHRS